MRWRPIGRWLSRPWALTLVFFLSLPAVTHRLNASDEIEYFAWLRSAVFDRDADFENEYRHFYEAAGSGDTLFRETFLERFNENGRRHNFAPIGTAVLWSPFFGMAHLLAGWLGYPQDGYSMPYVTAVTTASAVYGWLALLLSMAIARQLAGEGTGVWVVWLGTPLLFYMYVAPGFSHACSAFTVALMIWVWLRVRERWSPRGTLLVGLVAGLLPMVREQDVFFLVGPAVDFLRWSLSRRDNFGSTLRGASHHWAQPVSSAFAGLLGFAVVYASQLYAYLVLNGHLGPDATVSHKMAWTSPHLLGVLFSPDHGLFAWTPAALVAVGGLVTLAGQGGSAKYKVGSTKWEVRSTTYDIPGTTGGQDAESVSDTTPRDIRWIASLALLMFALQAYVSGCVESWTVAGSFGQRRFVSLTPILALGLSACFASRRTRKYESGTRGTSYFVLRTSYLLALFLSVWWNLGLMAQFGLHVMDRQRLTLIDNARVTFFELPLRAPSIAWRYLTDRESFYRLPRD